MTAVQLNAEILRNLGTLAEDESISAQARCRKAGRLNADFQGGILCQS